jgi:PAS domain S-box-containing protein
MAELRHPSHRGHLPSMDQLIDDWPDAVLMYDGDDERYLFVNKAAEHLVGCTREEILAGQPADFSHPGDVGEIPSVLAEAEREGWVRRPWRVLRKDGTVVQTELTLAKCRIDGRSILQGIYRVVGDGLLAGAPRRAAVDERLEILERTSLAVVTLDREGVVTSWNAGATEHFRLPAHDTVGRQVLDLARSDEDRAYVESLMEPHVDRNEWTSRMTIHPPDDAAYDALVTCSAIRSDDGELSGFLMITAPLEASPRPSAPRMRRARVQCAACGREVAGTMRRKYCSEKCRQWAYYHRHLGLQRARSRQRHERRRGRAGERIAGDEDAGSPDTTGADRP